MGLSPQMALIYRRTPAPHPCPRPRASSNLMCKSFFALSSAQPVPVICTYLQTRPYSFDVVVETTIVAPLFCCSCFVRAMLTYNPGDLVRRYRDALLVHVFSLFCTTTVSSASAAVLGPRSPLRDHSSVLVASSPAPFRSERRDFHSFILQRHTRLAHGTSQLHEQRLNQTSTQPGESVRLLLHQVETIIRSPCAIQ